WKQDVPWAKAGEVTVALGGDIAKELGVLPDATALQPIAPPTGAAAAPAPASTAPAIAAPPPAQPAPAQPAPTSAAGNRPTGGAGGGMDNAAGGGGYGGY